MEGWHKMIIDARSMGTCRLIDESLPYLSFCKINMRYSTCTCISWNHTSDCSFYESNQEYMKDITYF